MKVTAFNASPKGESSNTHVMVSALLKGAAAVGAEVENVFLADKTINQCKACLYCMTSGGKCAIKDDMQELIATYLASDIIVFATPLFIENVSGMLKVFMDRTYCIGNPYLEKGADGEYCGAKSEHFKNGTQPKIVVIANAGNPGRSSFQAISFLMHRFARLFHFELVAEIYAVEGPLLTAGVPQLEPIINDYKQLLHKAGQEIVLNMTLSTDTQRALEKPFIPVDVYVEKMNDLAKQYYVRPENQ